MKKHWVSKSRSLALSLVAVAALAGCGGVDYITVAGIAAEGPALANATVTVTCASGTAQATPTTGTSGAYSVIVAEGSGPCLVTATKTVNNTPVTYRAVTAGSGSTLTANVTPISTFIVEVLVKEYGAASAAALLTNATARTVLTGSTTNFVQAVKNALDAAATAGNTVAASLVAQFGTSDLQTVLAGSFAVGDATDAKLDTVVTAWQAAGLVGTSGEIVSAALDTAATAVQSNFDAAVTTGATGTGATGAGN